MRKLELNRTFAARLAALLTVIWTLGEALIAMTQYPARAQAGSELMVRMERGEVAEAIAR
jgi:hypothetical protein